MKTDWEVKTLGEVCTKITDGSHFSPKSADVGEYPYVTVRDIDQDQINFGGCKFIDETSYKALLKNGCQPIKGDILFSKDGTVGKVSLVDFDKDFVVLSSLAIIRPKKDVVSSELLKHILKSPLFLQEALGKKTGAAIRRIILNNLKQIEIRFPKSFSEQQRIVAILDEAFATIDKAKENAQKNLQNARELFESYLQSVFVNPGEGWEEKKLKQITTKIGSGATPRGGHESYHLEGIPLIRSLNVHDRGFRIKDLAFLDKTQADKLANVTVQSGDVLLNITGASIARCCVVPEEMIPARVNQHVSIIRLMNDLMLPKFLHLVLTSKLSKDELLSTGDKNGATRQALTKSQIEDFVVRYPKSIKKQQEVIDKIDGISAETKKLEAIYQQKLTDLDELKKAILQKAFQGELTAVQTDTLAV